MCSIFNNNIIFSITRLLTICLTVILLPCSHCLAQGDENSRGETIDALLSMSLEELIELEVTIATGTPIPLKLAPSVATVVTKEKIEATGATNLEDVLETVPGFHVTPSGTFFTPIWSIRGIHTSVSPEVLLLINGVPFTSNYVGNRGFLYRMPVSMISRVEVVRGPGSALYGADAYSGVVNVITKDNSEIAGTEIGGRAGSFDTYNTWLQHGGHYRGWDIALGIEWQKSRGDDDSIVEKDYLHAIGAAMFSNAPGPVDTHYETLDTNLQIRKGDWGFHLYSQLLESGLGSGATKSITYGNDHDIRSFLTYLTYSNDNLLDYWDLNCRLYYSYMHTDSFFQFFPTNFLNMIGNPISTSIDGGIEVAGIYNKFNGHKIRLGAGWKNYEIEPDQYKNFGPAAGANQFGPPVHITDPNQKYMDDANRHLFYGLVQDEWELADRLELTTGVRYDEYSDFGSTINPRIALVWKTSHDLITKLLYGRAFRAPSFSEQYVKNNPTGTGNADLEPQTIHTMELAFDYQPTVDLGLKLNFFHYEADDLIALTGSTLPQEYKNFAEQEGNGFELELNWRLNEELQLLSNFAYQRAINKTSDTVVHDAPEMQLYCNPHWDFLPNWSLDGQYFWIAGRKRVQGDPRDEIDDYHLVNLTLRWKNTAQHWDVAIAVRNLFDGDVREPSSYDSAAPEGAYIPGDYPIKSRAIWGELRFYF